MDFVEQVKNSVDIVRVIGDYVRLKRLGSTETYRGLCPFHSEKTPSFNVRNDLGFYHCFGCHAGGDMFTFVMQMEGLTFFEALRLVAERNGIPVPRRTDYSDRDAKLRSALYEMHEIAAALFQSNLRASSGAEARKYLAERGIAEQQWDEFGLGLSDASGQQLTRRLQERGFTPDQLEVSGLVLKRQEGGGFFDRFRARLMFPIHNESGKAIAFGGRALRPGDEPKYLNSSESEIYKKKSVLYNLHRAKQAIRQHDRAILVEGYMDVIGVYAAGIHEVVACCGTSFTDDQVRSIKRHSENLIVNFDPDAAGANATEGRIEKLHEILVREGMHVRVLELDADLDPDEYIKEHGIERYEGRLAATAPYFHWLADRARSKFDMRDVDGRMQGWKLLQPAIQRIPDKLQRIAVVNDLAAYLGVDASAILEQFRKASGEAAGRNGRNGKAPADPASRVPAIEKMLLAALLESEEARVEVLPRLKGVSAARQFVTWNILEALMSAAEQGEVTYADVEARLNEADRTLLPRILLTDSKSGDGHGLEQALACLRKIEGESVKQRIGALKDEIRAAERGGDLAAALGKADELRRLERG